AGVALIDDNGASASAALTQRAASTLADDGVVIAAESDADFAARQAVARAASADMFFESYYDFDITASAESDNGVSVSVGFDMGAGNKIDYNDDDVLEAQGNTVGDADVAVSYAGWTLTVDQAGIDNLFDDTDGAQDVSIAGSIAGWSVAMTSDQEGATSSYSVSGNVGGVALTLTGTDNDDNGGAASKIAASYAMGNGLTLTGSVEDESLADGSEDEQTVGFSYAMDALTVGYTAIKPGKVAGADAFGDEWDLSLTYSAGAMVASFAIDEADATTIIADYALGGGASAFAAMHDKAGTADDLTAVGLNFAF
ncbi:porin, partial [Planktomarina temperata]|nr:porin [Planktomarina temperata]